MPTPSPVVKVPAITPDLLEKNEQDQARWRKLYTAPPTNYESYAGRIIRDHLETLDRLEAQRKSSAPADRPVLTEKIRRLKDDTAIWCDSIGQFELAAKLTSCKHQRKTYKHRAQAIDLPDDAWCEHPVFENIDGHISQVAARERDFFSHRHGKTVSMIVCRHCGFRNAKDLPKELKKLSEHRAQARATGKDSKAKLTDILR
jgi:hypothetical protein